MEKYGWIPVDATLKRSNPKNDYFGKIPRRFVVTSVGNDITVLSCEAGKLVPKKSGGLQTYYSRTWYNKKIEYEMIHSFEAY